jgi:hypothetical protein
MDGISNNGGKQIALCNDKEILERNVIYDE